jgi:hypothetical protein
MTIKKFLDDPKNQFILDPTKDVKGVAREVVRDVEDHPYETTLRLALNVIKHVVDESPMGYVEFFVKDLEYLAGILDSVNRGEKVGVPLEQIQSSLKNYNRSVARLQASVGDFRREVYGDGPGFRSTLAADHEMRDAYLENLNLLSGTANQEWHEGEDMALALQRAIDSISAKLEDWKAEAQTKKESFDLGVLIPGYEMDLAWLRTLSIDDFRASVSIARGSAQQVQELMSLVLQAYP